MIEKCFPGIIEARNSGTTRYVIWPTEDESRDEDLNEDEDKMKAEGWRFHEGAHPAIGKRTRRFFRSHRNSAPVDGRILAYLPAAGNEEALWKNQHSGTSLK